MCLAAEMDGRQSEEKPEQLEQQAEGNNGAAEGCRSAQPPKHPQTPQHRWKNSVGKRKKQNKEELKEEEMRGFCEILLLETLILKAAALMRSHELVEPASSSHVTLRPLPPPPEPTVHSGAVQNGRASGGGGHFCISL